MTPRFRFQCLFIAAIATGTWSAYAAVVTRPSTEIRSATARVQNRGATMSAPSASVQVSDQASEPEVAYEEPIIVDNKSSMFGAVISDMSAGAPNAENDTALADRIREQRLILDGQYNAPSSAPNVTITANACDKGLRDCMAGKCGNDFTKCANDNAVAWDNKMNACRAKTQCSAHEYTLLAPEIAADRDMNVRTAYYNSVINCGTKYNECIFEKCGMALNGCLAKKDEDKAIAACASIARECTAQDNGMTSRFMNIFADLRTAAIAQAKKDEERLYELRDLMRQTCNRFGAMFDDRTLDCVYTVNFFAGNSENPMASKKLYAGDTFQCNADWFGIDVTTFKENAYRTTREQTSASSAMLGAGLGTAAGLISSGAISRANEAREAKNEAKDACEQAGKHWYNGKCNDQSRQEKRDERKAEREDKRAAKKTEKNNTPQIEKPKEVNKSLTQENYNADKSLQAKAVGDTKFNSNDFKVEGITTTPKIKEPAKVTSTITGG